MAIDQASVDSQRTYHQIIITDPGFLSGVSVKEIVAPVIKQVNIQYILLDDIVGAVSGLNGQDGQLMLSAEFLEKVGDADQYDWGFFFLYQKNKPEDSLVDHDNHRNLIAGADVTIRLVDDQYVYVYTTIDVVQRDLVMRFPSCGRQVVNLMDLDIPY